MTDVLHEVQRQGWSLDRFVAPTTVSAAVDALVEHGPRARPVAGGSDLLLELDRRARPDVSVLVDLTGIDELAGIQVVDDGIRLGALVTHNQVVASEDCRRLLRPLAQACWEVGSPQLRNRATVVGNVVTASPANDTISALLALGATVEITGPDGRRRVGLETFITGFRAVDLGPGELVTGLIVTPLDPRQRGVFVKLGLRRAQAISVVHLAAVVGFGGQDVVSSARLAVGSVGPTVEVLDGVAAGLVGGPLSDEQIAAAAHAAADVVSPIDDLRAPADYRRRLVATMTTRALRALATDGGADPWPDPPPLLAPDQVGVPSTATPVTVGSTGSRRTAGSSGAVGELGEQDAFAMTVNGQSVIGAGIGRSLLDWLRDRAGASGVKEGCAEGECGACTVLVDGAAVMSCLVPAASARGADVVTVEGLAGDRSLHVVQEAFVRTGAVQCGFCTPGFVVAAAALLDEDPEPDRDRVCAGLAGNLCRCTGYEAIHTALATATTTARAADADDGSGAAPEPGQPAGTVADPPSMGKQVEE